MNRLCNLWCAPRLVQKTHGGYFHFRNGTIVIARTYDAAIESLQSVHEKDPWATETKNGIWTVKFGQDVCVDNVVAPSVIGAVRTAQAQVDRDAESPVLV
jgi:S-methylmethionine-dependent homocysteine/selenocysteine methylase